MYFCQPPTSCNQHMMPLLRNKKCDKNPAKRLSLPPYIFPPPAPPNQQPSKKYEVSRSARSSLSSPSINLDKHVELWHAVSSNIVRDGSIQQTNLNPFAGRKNSLKRHSCHCCKRRESRDDGAVIKEYIWR